MQVKLEYDHEEHINYYFMIILFLREGSDLVYFKINLISLFRTLSVLTSKAATRDIWLDRLDEEPILSHVLFVLPHTRDETLCDKMLLLLINMTWYSESVTEKLKNLNIVVTLAGAIDRKVQSNDGYFVNHWYVSFIQILYIKIIPRKSIVVN
jgi:hypothetical protein